MKLLPVTCMFCAFALLFSALPVAAQEWPELSSPGEVQGGGEKDAALVVGIEDYVFASDIPGAVQNANDWYLYLTRNRKVPVSSVFLLRNSEGTRENILEKAKEAASQVEPGGTLWVVFVGHGAPGKDGKDGILVGSDAQQSANSLYARSLPQKELLRALKNGTQDQTVAFIDACFSGKGSKGKELVAGLQPLLPVASKISSATVLTAGEGDQFAGPLPGINRPAFSYLALGALRGWGDRDGVITPREIADYSRDTLRVVLRDRSQSPTIAGPGQDQPLALNAREEGPDLSEFVLAPTNPGTGAPSITRPDSGARPEIKTGVVRIGGGILRLDAAALETSTLDTEVSHGSDTIFSNFELDINNISEGITPLSVGVQWTWGLQGFYFGTTAGLAWAEDLNVSARVSSSDAFSENVTQLRGNGVEAKITSYFSMRGVGEAGYQLQVHKLANLYVQAGLGINAGFYTLEFKVDEKDNSPTISIFDFILPLTLGVDFKINKNLFAHAGYSRFLLPSSSDSFQAGVGVAY